MAGGGGDRRLDFMQRICLESVAERTRGQTVDYGLAVVVHAEHKDLGGRAFTSQPANQFGATKLG